MKKSQSELLGDLFRAYFDTRKHKRNTNSQLKFEFNFEHNLVELCNQIVTRTYRPNPAICFITEVPVKREIFASPFAHRIVCRLLYNYIAPMFEARMIFDSYSCREGKGVLVGIERLEHHLRSCTPQLHPQGARSQTRPAGLLHEHRQTHPAPHPDGESGQVLAPVLRATAVGGATVSTAN